MMPKPDADLEIDPDPQLEREADRAAEEALKGENPLTGIGSPDVHAKRISADKVVEAIETFEAVNEESGVE